MDEMNVSINTITLKLYKPSLRKRIIIDEAMLNYSKAYQYLLDKAEEEIEVIAKVYKDNKGKYRANDISKWISKDLYKELNRFSVEPFKDSIKIDFAASLAGYLNLKSNGNDIKFPSAYMSEEAIEKTITEYMESCESFQSIESKIKKITDKAGSLRPIFFCRYATNRNYSLIYNPKNQRYYAKIHLLNVKSEKREVLAKPIGKILKYIDKNKSIFEYSSSRKTFLLFPLAFGKWQEEYIKAAIENPDIIKTARLLKRKGEYFLSINLVKDRPQLIEAENYMGISRGIDNVINYAIVDKEGKIVKQDFKNVENSNITENKIHEVANYLVKVAEYNKCQVIMEKLTDKADRLAYTDKDGKRYTPALESGKYNKLVNILDYKIQDKGLKPIIKVSSINIFYTCPHCGRNSKANRFSSKMLICTSCGIAEDIEKAGSLNLAKRLIKNSKDTIKIKAENTIEGFKLTNEELGFEFYPANPYDCVKEFKEEIDKYIKKFYDNIDIESKSENFKKRYSLIKKIEANKDVFQFIMID